MEVIEICYPTKIIIVTTPNGDVYKAFCADCTKAFGKPAWHTVENPKPRENHENHGSH